MKTVFVALLLVFSAPLLAEPAIVVNFDNCNGFDADGSLYTVPANQAHTVVTNSKNGNTKLVCHGMLPEDAPLPKKAQITDYLDFPAMCNAAFGVGYQATDDWKAVTTPSGNISLVCKFKN